MAHFAEVIDGVVKRVLAVANACIVDENGIEQESLGLNWLPPTEGVWIQTSYNHNFRGTYAGVGYTYDAARDVFVAPPEPELLTPPLEEE